MYKPRKHIGIGSIEQNRWRSTGLLSFTTAAPDESQQPKRQRRINVYDESENWEDWFSREEYVDPWGKVLEPLDYQPLDDDTRRVIQQLQDAYHGVAAEGQATPITTEQCNGAIQDLGDYKLGGKKLMGRAERAHMILKCMELFYSLPQHDEKQPLPLPNRETEFGVLHLYASSTSHFTDRRVPDTCLDIVRRIDQRYRQSKQQNKSKAHGDTQKLLRANVVLWNQVFAAWAICTDPEKAYEAAKLLQNLKQEDPTLIDSSSYGHVLRACASSKTSDKSKKLGSEIAHMVWSDFQGTKGLEPNSYMFAFYLQACQFMDDPWHRHKEVERAFQDCLNTGMVNAHVLNALKLAASKRLYNKLLEVVIPDITLHKPPLSDSEIARQLPYEWTCNAKVKTQWGW